MSSVQTVESIKQRLERKMYRDANKAEELMAIDPSAGSMLEGAAAAFHEALETCDRVLRGEPEPEGDEA